MKYIIVCDAYCILIIVVDSSGKRWGNPNILYIVPILSDVPKETRNPNILKKANVTTKFIEIVSASAMYFASMLESATIICFLLRHEIGELLSIKHQKPVVDWRFVGSHNWCKHEVWVVILKRNGAHGTELPQGNKWYEEQVQSEWIVVRSMN